MSTCADIVTRAARKLNVVALGETLSTAEQTNALAVLSSIVGEYYRRGVFGRGVSRPPTLAGSPSPFGDDYYDAAASMLAARLAVDYAATASPLDIAAAKQLDADLLEGRAEIATDAQASFVPTVTDIIYGAARKLVGIKAGALTPYQQQAGLQALTGLFQEWAAQGTFGAMWDGISSASPMPNMLGPGLRMRAENNPELSLPDRVERWTAAWGGYGASYDYGWRDWPVWPRSQDVGPPRDLSICVVANPDGGDSATYLYDAQAGTWVNISKLTLTTPCPLAQKHAETLKAALAVRLADDFGVQVKPTTQQTAQRGVSAMAMRWDSVREIQPGVFF